MTEASRTLTNDRELAVELYQLDGDDPNEGQLTGLGTFKTGIRTGSNISEIIGEINAAGLPLPDRLAAASVFSKLVAAKAHANGQDKQPTANGQKLTGDDRRSYLLSVAGYVWRRWDLLPTALAAMVKAMNEAQCDPPVGEKILRGIVEKVVAYDHNKKDFNLTLAMWEDMFEFLGYRFRRNLAGNLLEVNGEPVDDYERAEIIMRTALAMPANVGEIERAYMTVAKDNSYHEVVEKLESFNWDGEDHIWKLCSYIQYEDPPGQLGGWLEIALTRWLVGCVAKAYSQMPDSKESFEGVQTFMLVLEGDQGLGKSHLVDAISAPFGAKYFVEGPLATDDKDTRVRMLSMFIWEVSELGATIRKQDVEALKALISQKRSRCGGPMGNTTCRDQCCARCLGL